jgi:alkyl hydroperoxide reductase subunit AhpF
MPLLTDDLRNELRDAFSTRLERPVELRLVVSAQATDHHGDGCLSCETARALLEEVVAAARSHLTLTVVDVDVDSDDPRAEGVTQTPTLLVAQPGIQARIRYQGLPAGYEFGTIVEAIERVSAADTAIKPSNAARVEGVGTPVEDATEFPELSRRHGVSGVPRIAVNRSGSFVGAMPEDRYVAGVVRLAGRPAA